MALFTIDRRCQITAANDGDRLVIGEASREVVGAIAVQFVPDTAWDGTLTVVGRLAGAPASDDGVDFGPIPYRRATVAGVASDYAPVSDAIVSGAIILIPSSALSVAIDVTVNAGTGVLYSWPLLGSVVP